MRIRNDVTPALLSKKIGRLWELSAAKLSALMKEWDPLRGSPVFTVEGRYTTRGWTEWTQGFLYGSALLQYDATGEERFLQAGTEGTWKYMASHLTHTGVHDHGFNNISTYGNLRRLIVEGRTNADEGTLRACEIALKCSGAVQAARWTKTADGGGFIHSFNGPHSLFVDTIRTLRVLVTAHALGHCLMGEQDECISLLGRAIKHARVTAHYNVYYGTGRDAYDVKGRVAHESIFNPANGVYRCPSTQQGYSPFSTWTRGLAWAMLGFAEQLEFLQTRTDEELTFYGGRAEIEKTLLEAATATCEFYIENTPLDGIPYWDTGAPGLAQLGDYLDRPSDPFNDHEPVDSSAAAIAAQGLLRLGRFLEKRGRSTEAERYRNAGLTVADALFDEPYLSTGTSHQGLILHSVYHRPNGWDHIPAGRKIPCGESSMWGDYHARELALYIQRLAEGGPYLTFFGPVEAVR